MKAAHPFFITICAASGSGGMEVFMKNRKTYFWFIIILLFFLFTNAYTLYLNYYQAQNILKLQKENSELSIVKSEYSNKIFQNELDIIAKAFIKAMIDKDDNTIKKYVAKNIEVNKNLQIKLLNNSIINYSYPSEINTLKQSFFDQNEFRIGYEYYNNKNTINFIIISFIREQNQWKIQNVENDT